ncbi:MAG: hypothetical protein JRE64_21215 [Deltaproteobacteria bacterium]|nr:hypothetical protein [Deltaproteobacteria bacterium]
MERIYQISTLIFYGCAGGAAFSLGLIIGLVKGEGGRSALRGLEALLLSTIGAFLSAGFINGMFYLAKSQRAAGLAIGWGFFLVPGLIDSIRAIWSAVPKATTPQVLTWCALSIGAFGGMMDGVFCIHRWRGFGVLTFLVDYTWGLVGSTLGCLIHLVNTGWGDHTNHEREGGHLYGSGFRLAGGFAHTQGNVMSNMGQSGPNSNLCRHEKTHTLQNRIFGPFFVLSALTWAVIMFIPGMIAGGVKNNATVGDGIFSLCYRNSLWEAWARSVGGQTLTEPLVWSTTVSIIVGIIFLILCIAGGVSISLAVFNII